MTAGVVSSSLSCSDRRQRLSQLKERQAAEHLDITSRMDSSPIKTLMRVCAVTRSSASYLSVASSYQFADLAEPPVEVWMFSLVCPLLRTVPSEATGKRRGIHTLFSPRSLVSHGRVTSQKEGAGSQGQEKNNFFVKAQKKRAMSRKRKKRKRKGGKKMQLK